MKLSNLHIGYQDQSKKKILIKDLSIEFKPSRLYAIVGVNGIGKTTLLKTISDEIKPIGGSIEIDHKALESIPTKELAKLMSVVYTTREENKFLSVYEMIQMGRYPYVNWLGKLSNDDHKQIREAILLFNLESLVDQKCSALSDGQLQMVLLARAFAQDCPYILLDEPSNHLDLPHKVQLFQILHKLVKKHNKTIIICTHEIEKSLEFCDELLVVLKEEYFFDSPEVLINKGVFNKLFPKELVTFNSDKKRFNYHNSNE